MIKLIKSTFFNEAHTKRELISFIRKAKQLSIGDYCALFEKQFSKWQGRTYTVMYNSGSSANLALIQALINTGRLTKGQKVAFSGITWSTNVMPLIQLGLQAIPLDVSEKTLNVSPKILAEAYKKEKFSCLFLTNLLGFADDMRAIQSFCKKNSIFLIEDNCEGLGSEYKGEKLGNFGFASTFSFFVGHHMSTIEGGAVCTDDPELNRALRMVRSHGWDRHLTTEEQVLVRTQHGIEDFYSKYTFYDLGYNLRPMEIQGFLGVNQLQYLSKTIKTREKNYKALEKIYKNKDFFPLVNKMSLMSNFAFPLIAKTKELKTHYMHKAHHAGIEIRPIVGGNMTAQPFHKKHNTRTYDLPNATAIHELGFYFGNNPELTKEEIRALVETFSKR